MGPVKGPKRSDVAIYAELREAIDLAGGVTPCRESNLFTTTSLSAGDVRIAAQVCDSCPIFADCLAAGRDLSTTGRANTVMGGVSYDDKGRLVNDRLLTLVARTSKLTTRTAGKAAA
jgi:hypothetical protein